MWNSAVITNAGKELLAKWLEGVTLNIDGAATGEGTVADAYLMAQTGLFSQKQSLGIVRMEAVEGGVRLQLQCTSESITAGYTINQVGVWASLDGGTSVMIALYQDSIGVSVPTYVDMPDFVFTFYATLQMSNIGTLTATVNHEAMVTRADFDAEKTERGVAEAAIQKDYTDKIDTEAQTRKTADDALSKRITDEVNARQVADTNLQKDYDGKITTETEARQAGDTALSKNIADERTARQTADNSLQSDYTAKIATEKSDRQKEIAEERTARSNGDTTLQTNLNSHTANKNNPHSVTQKQLIDAVSVATDLADTDFIPFADVSAGTACKISKANFKKALGLNTITGAAVTLGGALTYTGSTLTKTVSSVAVGGKTLTAGTDYVVSGNTAVNAGTYTLVITGIGQYYGSIGRTWEIAKATGSVSTSVSSLSIVGAIGSTRTFTVSRSGDGAITVDSADPTVVQATLSGTTVTVKAIKGGSTTIIVKVDAGTNHNSASKTLSVTTFIADATLNNNTWATIRAISNAGVGSAIWPVGATKSVEVKGTVGTQSINEKLWVYILGFNHNATREGSNRIHFQGFKTSQSGGVDVGLVDNNYASGYTDGTKSFSTNHWGNYNYGGWKGSDLRYDILGSTNIAPSGYGSAKASGTTGGDATSSCPTSPVSGTLMAALPSDLRSVMKPITKYTDNVGGAAGHVLENVTASVDYLPLLSPVEVFGITGPSNSNESSYQAQYAYYANGNSKVKYKHSDSGVASAWLLRSPFAIIYYIVSCVSTDGRITDYTASASRAVAPAFAV